LNHDSSASAVHSLVTIMTTVFGSILGKIEFIPPPGKKGWREFVEIFYKETQSGRRRRTHKNGRTKSELNQAARQSSKTNFHRWWWWCW
jgi:5-bromo-4-chloroindolyl phosphate hydrolysis protein